MSGRVLNFFEFSDKYSTGNSDPLGMDNMSNAAANFEEGFDDSTYDQPELGPKRPVPGSYEATPAGPGEEGAPAFSPGARATMDAPNEDEEDDDFETEEEEDDDSGNPEGEEADEEEEEKVEESFRLVKSFSRFVNESYDDYYGEDESSYDEYADDYSKYDDEEYAEDYGANPTEDPAMMNAGANPDDYFGYGANPTEDPAMMNAGANPTEDPAMMNAGANPEDEHGMYPEDEDYEGEEFCSNCGAMGDEYGYSCGCNM